MEKLYIVKHIRLSIIYKQPKDEINKNSENLRIFKKREKAVKFIDDWYNTWADAGTFYDCIEIETKTRHSDGLASVSYYAHGPNESISILEQYIIEEVDYDE